MKKYLYTLIAVFALILMFYSGFQIGNRHSQQPAGTYYAIEGHFISYDTAKNRVEFQTPNGLRYYAYGDFEYDPNSLDFLLVMWDNNSTYLLDDYIINYTPVSIPIAES